MMDVKELQNDLNEIKKILENLKDENLINEKLLTDYINNIYNKFFKIQKIDPIELNKFNVEIKFFLAKLRAYYFLIKKNKSLAEKLIK